MGFSMFFNMSLREENKRKFSIYNQQHHPLEVNTFSKDLLQSFVTPNIMPSNFDEISQSGEDEIELSLGLSLNGRFGVDPKRAKLSRSTSIPEFLKLGNYAVPESPPPPPPPPLVRTFSLPAETGEEYLKRKEMQSMKRFKAKKEVAGENEERKDSRRPKGNHQSKQVSNRRV